MQIVGIPMRRLIYCSLRRNKGCRFYYNFIYYVTIEMPHNGAASWENKQSAYAKTEAQIRFAVDQDNMSVTCLPPWTPLLYSKTGVCRGIAIFLIFAPKHRSRVLGEAVLMCSHSPQYKSLFLHPKDTTYKIWLWLVKWLLRKLSFTFNL